jgi:hypothetical protein
VSDLVVYPIYYADDKSQTSSAAVRRLNETESPALIAVRGDQSRMMELYVEMNMTLWRKG